MVSHPARHFFTFATGTVGRRSAHVHAGTRIETISVTAEFAKGSSGAAVLNENAGVVALVNNTESIYYDVAKDGDPIHFQMAVKNCTPAEALSRLLQ